MTKTKREDTKIKRNSRLRRNKGDEKRIYFAVERNVYRWK